MYSLPSCFSELKKYKQFINYKLVPKLNGKKDKLPVNASGKLVSAHDPSAWISADDALRVCVEQDLGLAFVFTKDDPFFFLDVDDCLTDQNTWSHDAQTLLDITAGAAVEVSQSRRGIHIIGKCSNLPEHSCESKTIKASLFTELRFVALTGISTSGSSSFDCGQTLDPFIAQHWPPNEFDLTDWTDSPEEGWGGEGLTDDELVAKAVSSTSTAGQFGGSASFASLWGREEDTLSIHFPDDQGVKPYDESQADSSLAQHLAFWTGKNCEHIETLMRQSALARVKYDERPDYLFRTIKRAVSLQKNIYTKPAPPDTSVLEKFGACKLRASSDAQRQFAESIRCEKLAQCTSEDEAIQLAQQTEAKLFIENRDKTPTEILSSTKPVEKLEASVIVHKPTLVSGFQFLAADKQIELFDQCVYVQDVHKIFTPGGVLLNPERFNATYGGYVFQLDDSGRKETRKPWEAFTESQVVRFPKVSTTCFRPQLSPGSIIDIEGTSAVNTYIPIQTRSIAGDPTPFLNHLEKLLPDSTDREILLSYMAACVQHPGVKFQWAPLIQGMEGNGKTLLTRCVAFAIGEKYTHFPPAPDLAEKFNAWLFGKLFIGVEDIYVSDNKREILETLKPMITGDRLSKREMQQSQMMSDSCANFMFNSNYQDGVRITDKSRRFAPFYTAQQELKDLVRDGMTGDYFQKLYDWLKIDGYAIVNNLLRTYVINERYNPAGDCQRAPSTSSTLAAIASGLGGIEQEILEAVAENRRGFCGGWISSVALDDLLHELRAQRRIPPNKRREVLKELGYDWHPALDKGRVNNPIAMDSNKKPRLFIKAGHLALNTSSAAEVSRMYQDAQCFDPSVTNMSERFK